MFKEIAGAVTSAIVGVGLLVIALAPALLVYGYVLSHLWVWFIVPQFGLPALSLASAVGVSLVTGYMSSGQRNGREIEKKLSGMDYFKNYCSYRIMLPFMLLGVGYIVQRFL